MTEGTSYNLKQLHAGILNLVSNTPDCNLILLPLSIIIRLDLGQSKICQTLLLNL